MPKLRENGISSAAEYKTLVYLIPGLAVGRWRWEEGPKTKAADKMKSINRCIEYTVTWRKLL